jgi:hypothetical protein
MAGERTQNGLEKIDLDSFLTSQDHPSLKATVERVEGEADLVKITPWLPEMGGCMCSAAIKVTKSAIEWVKPTDDTHYCCGKTLRVVEVQFKEAQAISLNDLFAQLGTSAGVVASQRLASEIQPQYTPAFSPFGALPSSGYADLRMGGYPRHQAMIDGPFAGQNPHDMWCARERDACIAACNSVPWVSEACKCACRNFYCSCSGRCRPEWCPSQF